MKISHLVTYVNGLGRCEDAADCRSRGAGGGRPGRDDKSHLSRRAFGPGLLRRWRAWAAMSPSSPARPPPPITPRPVRIEQAGLYRDPVSLKDPGESRLGGSRWDGRIVVPAQRHPLPAAGGGGQIALAQLRLGEPSEQITEHRCVIIADPGHKRRLFSVDGADELAVQGPAARRRKDQHAPAVSQVPPAVDQ